MKLSIGSAQFGFRYGICNKIGIVKKQEVKKIINYCKIKKINSIDTAQGYGNSHKILGSFNLNKFQITTKISNIKKKKINDLESFVNLEVDKILKELNKKKVYALLIHDVSQLKGKFGKNLYKALENLKKKKKFNKLGISVYTKKELDFILKNYNIDIVNLPISVANQEFCKKNYLLKLKKKNIEIHVRSIFLQGLLLSNYRYLPRRFKNNKFFLEWFNWLKINNYNSLEASLGFIKDIKYIKKIIIGVDSYYQLKMIVKAYNKSIKYNFKNFSQSLILRNPSKW
jgi:aryl-alcohol dehydrogenase-like predicted oxidoreductase